MEASVGIRDAAGKSIAIDEAGYSSKEELVDTITTDANLCPLSKYPTIQNNKSFQTLPMSSPKFPCSLDNLGDSLMFIVQTGLRLNLD
jgi:hypothetical protein